MHASRGIAYYRGATEFLSEHTYSMKFTQYVHTTRQYNTQIENQAEKKN